MFSHLECRRLSKAVKGLKGPKPMCMARNLSNDGIRV